MCYCAKRGHDRLTIGGLKIPAQLNVMEILGGAAGPSEGEAQSAFIFPIEFGGARRNRTDDLFNAIAEGQLIFQWVIGTFISTVYNLSLIHISEPTRPY